MRSENISDALNMLPDDMIAHVQSVREKKETEGKRWRFPSVTAAAAALALFFCGAAVSAAVKNGYFQDIKDKFGTVTGTEYNQASDEIQVSVGSAAGELTVLVSFIDQSLPPYSECEEFGIGSFQIVGASGESVVEGAVEPLSAIYDGRSEIRIPVDELEKGSYKLVITTFIGGGKADQPLKINGLWECDFTVQ